MAAGDSKWLTYGIPAASAAVGAYSAYAANRNARQDREQASEENELDRRYRAAVEETALNPFRHQMSQAGSLGALDVMANAQLSPARYSMPGITVPQLSGGFAYQPSADLRTSAKLLQRDVASGRTAPTMTNPANYGQTGVVNLNGAPGASASPLSPAQPRSLAPGATGAVGSRSPGYDPSALLQGVTRRNEGAGGALSGAAKGAAMGASVGKFAGGIGAGFGAVGGAVIGGIAGAATKNAKTAASDVSADDARAVIRQAYQTYIGREATPEEIEGNLANIGFDARRHRWVGEGGLLYILRELQAKGERDAAGAGALGDTYTGLFK